MELIRILADVAKILGVLGAFLIFCWNFVKARKNEEFEIHSTLTNAYTDFLKISNH